MKARRILIFLVSFLFATTSLNFAETVTSHIPRGDIESTAIKAVGYSKRKQILEVEFVNGAIYRYTNVPVSVYKKLMKSDSKARFYDYNIRYNYHSSHVRRRVKDQPKT